AQAVLTDLRRRGTRTYELSRRHEQFQAAAHLRGKELRLIETSLTQTDLVQRHRHRPRRGHSLDGQPLRHQLRERTGESSPALVFEAVHRGLRRALVGDGGAKPGKRSEASLAAALVARRLDLGTTPPAQRFLQPANPGAAPTAHPCPDLATPTATRRQDEVENVH